MRWVSSSVVMVSVTVLLAAHPSSAVAGWTYFHSEQNGHLKMYVTLADGTWVEPPFYDEAYYKSTYVDTGAADAEKNGLNIDPVFTCGATGQTTTTSYYAPYYDVGGSQWTMHQNIEWEGLLGLSDEHPLWMPGMNDDSQDLFVAVDLLAWQAGNGTYELTGPPEPLRYYQFVDGISNELPGVFLSNTPLVWNAGVPESDPYHGFASSGWYTSGPDEIYVCHETVFTPEPDAVLFVALGGLAVLRRRR